MMAGSKAYCSRDDRDPSPWRQKDKSSLKVDVYHQKGCQACDEMVDSLVNAGMEVNVYRVEVSANRRALWKLLDKVAPNLETVELPVVVLGYDVYVDPDLDKFLQNVVKPIVRRARRKERDRDDHDFACSPSALLQRHDGKAPLDDSPRAITISREMRDRGCAQNMSSGQCAFSDPMAITVSRPTVGCGDPGESSAACPRPCNPCDEYSLPEVKLFGTAGCKRTNEVSGWVCEWVGDESQKRGSRRTKPGHFE
uniref:Glutaredoxin domain-containing protein n=1 Tax=Chromera velia CCMP2878 TaxID=1169474 RepID=A0A0K6S9D4_9ALVE|eukprot:Cvel_28117.t2-p1 / transcript=Cvel_28117.t2 / gene=Cvel_28117 / organism=Chromera_velia_CCMP2878 / gene_product=hypothetical protein / transcript_product=hypothetical protein / location=Cvel_scaffold3623:2336-3091(+) / protein_length=252 / sequence_SO=supercontig / SO=protein_coding / is_pseudo=false